MTAITRVTVGLSADEAAVLDKLKKDDAPEAATLSSLTGITLGPSASDAKTIHALVVAGLQAVQELAEEIGYQRLAEFVRTDEESQAWRASRRTRSARRMASSSERGAA